MAPWGTVAGTALFLGACLSGDGLEWAMLAAGLFLLAASGACALLGRPEPRPPEVSQMTLLDWAGMHSPREGGPA